MTQDDVRMLTPMSRAGVIFELGNAISARQLQRALELLQQLLFNGEKAIGILLATIIPTVRNLLLAKDLLVRHKLAAPSNPFHFTSTLERLPAAAIAHLPRTKEGKLNAFSLGFAAAGARNFTLPELQAGLKACLDANVTLVSAPTETEVVLSQLLVRLIGGSKRARRRALNASAFPQPADLPRHIPVRRFEFLAQRLHGNGEPAKRDHRLLLEMVIRRHGDFVLARILRREPLDDGIRRVLSAGIEHLDATRHLLRIRARPFPVEHHHDAHTRRVLIRREPPRQFLTRDEPIAPCSSWSSGHEKMTLCASTRR